MICRPLPQYQENHKKFPLKTFLNEVTVFSLINYRNLWETHKWYELKTQYSPASFSRIRRGSNKSSRQRTFDPIICVVEHMFAIYVIVCSEKNTVYIYTYMRPWENEVVSCLWPWLSHQFLEILTLVTKAWKLLYLKLTRLQWSWPLWQGHSFISRVSLFHKYYLIHVTSIVSKSVTFIKCSNRQRVGNIVTKLASMWKRSCTFKLE